MDIQATAKFLEFSEKTCASIGHYIVSSLSSVNRILHILIKLSALTPFVCFTTRNVLWQSTIHDYVLLMSINASVSLVSQSLSGILYGISCLSIVWAEIQDVPSYLNGIFNVIINVDQMYKFSYQ